MRIPCPACFAAEPKVDADVVADGGHVREYRTDAVGAELGGEVLPLVHARGGGMRVEVEGKPGGGEGVRGVRVSGLVEGDGAVEFLFTDVALGTRIRQWMGAKAAERVGG